MNRIVTKRDVFTFFVLFLLRTNYDLMFKSITLSNDDRICGIVVRVPRYRSKGPGFISGAARFSEK
jgi:hypothetical protein